MLVIYNRMCAHLSESVPEEELLALSTTILLEKVMETSSLEAAMLSVVEAAARTSLSSHRVIRIVTVVISCSKFCTSENQSSGDGFLQNG